MKKIIALTALLVIVGSTSAFAAATPLGNNGISPAAATVYGGVVTGSAATSTTPMFKLSTGVSVQINFDTTGIGYAIFTKHVKGTKIFGTAYDSTAISFFTEVPGVLTTTNTGTATAVPTTSGWTTM